MGLVWFVILYKGTFFAGGTVNSNNIPRKGKGLRFPLICEPMIYRHPSPFFPFCHRKKCVSTRGSICTLLILERARWDGAGWIPSTLTRELSSPLLWTTHDGPTGTVRTILSVWIGTTPMGPFLVLFRDSFGLQCWLSLCKRCLISFFFSFLTVWFSLVYNLLTISYSHLNTWYFYGLSPMSGDVLEGGPLPSGTFVLFVVGLFILWFSDNVNKDCN